MQKQQRFQRGEIAALLTLFGVGILAVGALLGSAAMKQNVFKLFPFALFRHEVDVKDVKAVPEVGSNSRVRVDGNVCINYNIPSGDERLDIWAKGDKIKNGVTQPGSVDIPASPPNEWPTCSTGRTKPFTFFADMVGEWTTAIQNGSCVRANLALDMRSVLKGQLDDDLVSVEAKTPGCNQVSPTITPSITPSVNACPIPDSNPPQRIDGQGLLACTNTGLLSNTPQNIVVSRDTGFVTGSVGVNWNRISDSRIRAYRIALYYKSPTSSGNVLAGWPTIIQATPDDCSFSGNSCRYVVNYDNSILVNNNATAIYASVRAVYKDAVSSPRSGVTNDTCGYCHTPESFSPEVPVEAPTATPQPVATSTPVPAATSTPVPGGGMGCTGTGEQCFSRGDCNIPNADNPEWSYIGWCNQAAGKICCKNEYPPCGGNNLCKSLSQCATGDRRNGTCNGGEVCCTTKQPAQPPAGQACGGVNICVPGVTQCPTGRTPATGTCTNGACCGPEHELGGATSGCERNLCSARSAPPGGQNCVDCGDGGSCFVTGSQCPVHNYGVSPGDIDDDGQYTLAKWTIILANYQKIYKGRLVNSVTVSDFLAHYLNP